MDTARSYETVVVASLANAVLFPEVSLGDAAVLEKTSVEVQP
jgi:hypothetical protein